MKPSIALLALCLSSLPATGALYQYTTGHGDFRVHYDPGTEEFLPHIHLDGGAEYGGGDLLIVTDAQRVTGGNAASIARFQTALGVSAGTPIWVLGGSGVGPYLGFSGEGLASGDWVHTFPNPYTGDPYTGAAIHMTLDLGASSIPAGAAFAVYSTSGLPSTWGSVANGEVVFSTVDPSATLANNKLSIIVGDHVHYAFGFTQSGEYHLTFTFESVYGGTTPVSTSETFTFLIIPEPSVAVIAGIPSLGFLLRRRR